MSEVQEDSKSAKISAMKLAEIKVTDYMEKCLDKVAADEGFENYVIKVVHGSAVGDGFIGNIFKVIINEVNSKKVLNVILKAPPESQARREQFGSMQLFEREVFMYKEFLPAIAKFQSERNIPESEGFFNFPKVYLAEYDTENNEAIIIMEDLRDRGFQLWDKFTPTNFDHSKLVIKALAKLHAISFAMKILQPEVFDKFKILTDFLSINFKEPGIHTILINNITRAVDSLHKDDTKSRELALKLSENFIEQFTWLTDSKNAEPFAVVTHGDCWSNNFMYQYRGGVPDNVCLLDFQISRYASPALDLLYFLMSCTNEKLRAVHYDELLNIYHRTLRDFLEDLGGDPSVQFPLTAFLRQMKKFGRFGVYMATFLIPMLTTKNEDLPDMDEFAESGFKDQKDPEKMKEFLEGLMRPNMEFTTRCRGVIHDAIRFGYI